MRIPADLTAALKELSNRTDASLDVLVREAIELYLIEQQRPLPTSIGYAANPDLHGEDTEDWLLANWRPS